MGGGVLVSQQAPAKKVEESEAAKRLQERLKQIEFYPIAIGSGAETQVCPVTRQTLSYDQPLYRCEACSTTYSADGWDFLRKADNGKCCNCQEKNTVKLMERI